MSTTRVLVHIDCQPEIGERGFVNTANPPARDHRYYAMLNPRVLLITYRFPLERVYKGQRYDAQVGWNPGTVWAVRPGNAQYQHRRIALTGLPDQNTPELETIALSQLISEAPASAAAVTDAAWLSAEMSARTNQMAGDIARLLAPDNAVGMAASLDLLAKAVRGELTRDEVTAEAVRQASEDLVRFLTRAVWHGPEHPVDPGFWKSEVGDLCAQAHAWSKDDVWLTALEAAMLRYGRSGRGPVERLERESLTRGWIVRLDRSDPNLNRAQRYLRSQVER